MGMKAPISLAERQVYAPMDWKDIKARIIAALGPEGVMREYRALGIKFENGYNSKGKAICHAIDRPDETPSAVVFVQTGVYHANGASQETMGLFDFALKYGNSRFPDWLSTVKHYAEVAGVPLNARKDGKGRVLEATYDYTDEHGELLYQVIRYRLASGKKDFRQRRPDGKGGWVYDLEGVRRVIYKLPDVLADPLRTVVICEGEKDCDRLNELFRLENISAIATTGAQGTGDTGRWESYAELLKDRACLVIPDCDAVGLKHARGVCGYLHGIVKSVKLIELPGVGPKGDISDWLDQGNGIDDFWGLVVDAPDWEPNAQAAEVDADRDATAADLILANAGTKWLWPGWIPLGVLTLLTAEPSTGKTRFGLDLTKRIANGMGWPDGQPMDLGERRPVVLWIPADSQHSELADCPKTFGFPADAIVLNTTVGNLYGGTELQEEEQLKDLEDRISRQVPALVIIDTITNTSDAKNQDSADAKRQYKPLQEIAKRTGAPIMCVTHLNLVGKTLGRRADEKTRVTLRLERPDPEGQPNRRKLSVALTRLSVVPPALGVTMGDAGNDYDSNPPESPPENVGRAKGPRPAVQEAVGYLMTQLRHGPMRVSVIRTLCDKREPPISAKALYEAKNYLPLEEYEEEDQMSHKPYKWWKLTANEEANGQPY